MAGLGLTDILTAIQNGVTALNNLGQQVKGSFTNIAGRLTVLEALPYKVVLFTRNLATASGNQSVTGVGFQPRYIQWQAGIGGGNAWCSVGGTSDGASNICIEIAVNNPATGVLSTFFQSTFAGLIRTDLAGANFQSFTLASFDADGFTIAWSKNGTPTGTASITATCFR